MGPVYDAEDFRVDFKNTNPKVTASFETGASDADICSKINATFPPQEVIQKFEAGMPLDEDE